MAATALPSARLALRGSLAVGVPRTAPRSIPLPRRVPSHASSPRLPARRAQSTSAAPPPAPPSAPRPPTRDPDHPHLYYHVHPPRGIALSFLPDALPQGGGGGPSRVVLGYLPVRPDGRQAGLDDFEENKGFFAIRSAIAAGRCPTVTHEAALRPGDGYLHITDERRLPPAGRIGETEDLLGSVLVQGGKIVPDSYEPQPMYRLITADGPTRLPEGIDEHVLEVLQRVAREEREG